MLRMTIRLISLLTIAQFLTAAAWASPQQAQQPQKPLTNGDVIKMVKAGLPTGTIVSAIEASQTDFDISPDALISLKSAGISEAVMNAMISAQSNKRDSGSGVLAALANLGGTAGTAPSTLSPLHVNLLSATPASGTAASQVARPLTAERAQLSETQTKVTSLGGLVTDTAVSQGLESGVNAAAGQAEALTSSLGGSIAENVGTSEAESIVGSLLSRRDSAPTYAWAVQGAHSPNAGVPSSGATFEVTFTGVSGVNPDEYEPVIVKLAFTPYEWRLVGATQGKQNAPSKNTLDWQIYSGFLEDRVPAQSQRVKSGEYQISPKGTLAPGEYAVVLRPLSKGKKFSGSDISGNVGDGLLFNSVWSFPIK